ncbi:DUF3141 domain-containing protein [Ruegeria sp. 2012CJ41-6]|uniref:DUF3141 domain-containing protein n=1 Tax=Ruegeria spongiae TaxID=2942209 RepID=A0ABT0Q7B3_9RHOB|nr:DUF3141 domain-containing protein [Ruegeria spongiae]MCL6285766.1 DUF3141 domain-containing protein [Ruegeria spongiae]
MPVTNPWLDYVVDASQRTALFLDILRERGNQYNAHITATAPNVLGFEYDVVMDGRDLPEPVNYALIRIKPPKSVTIDLHKRPFVVIDPRAGHGPGIGGFKADSEIGVALAAGHPCYFIGFLPEPEPEQTIEKVMRAEVTFIEHVVATHPQADGKPAVIGNCQAGWAVAMLASYRPDLCGPIILAGAPLSYWAGVHGKNPMRYSGGLLGGSWLTALTGDLGAGKFDGAWLVQNFENMNPANTLWAKQHNVYAKVDTERERYLEFERWWGGHVILNAEEMQFIVDNLFVGNKLPTGGVVTSDGIRLDFRRIKSPIICFCSKGDDITPPQQALGWITDLYESVDAIRSHGQTIVYAVHDKVGHLGIFVSGSVARKEHREFASNIDFIDCLPPGLYEAVLTPKTGDEPDADLDPTDYITRFEARDLDDIRALGHNDLEDERRFAAVARLSEINTGLYNTFVHPWMEALVTPQMAEVAREMHPLRLGYKLASDVNPLMNSVRLWADHARENRKPVDPNNPFWVMQEQVSDGITTALETYGQLRDQAAEAMFMATYSNPLMQAMLGLSASDGPPRPHPGLDPEHRAFVAQRITELTAKMAEGGVKEAAVRALLYVLWPNRAADERRFEIVDRLREDDEQSLQDFKDMLREQFLMLLVDEDRAIETLPDLMAGQAKERDEVLAMIRLIAGTGGPLSPESEERLAQIEKLWDTPQPANTGKRARKQS